MSEQFFIVYGKDMITLNKNVSESRTLFIQRVEFLIYALDGGHSIIMAETLSHAYQNKRQYNARYTKEVEDIIQQINCRS